MKFEPDHISQNSVLRSPTHLHKHTLASKEGVYWDCAQCGWESAPMYFGEVYEPEHLCPNESLGAVP